MLSCKKNKLITKQNNNISYEIEAGAVWPSGRVRAFQPKGGGFESRPGFFGFF